MGLSHEPTGAKRLIVHCLVKRFLAFPGMDLRVTVQMAAGHNFQAAIAGCEAGDIEKDAYKGQIGAILGIVVAMPVGAVIPARSIESGAVVEANFGSDSRPHQSDHLRMSDETGEVIVMLGTVATRPDLVRSGLRLN